MNKNLQTLLRVLPYIPTDKPFAVWELSLWTGLNRFTVRKILYQLAHTNRLGKVHHKVAYWRHWQVYKNWNVDEVIKEYDFLTSIEKLTNPTTRKENGNDY